MELEEAYRLYFHDVYRFVRKLSGDAETAQDLTSETFFRAMKSLKDFRGDCTMRVWLCEIAKNCYYDDCRKKKRTALPLEEAESLLEKALSAEEEALSHIGEASIQRALHGLPEPYKEVFLWRALGDLSFKEIGALFHKSDNWACVTYHRARMMLQKEALTE